MGYKVQSVAYTEVTTSNIRLHILHRGRITLLYQGVMKTY